MKRETLEYIITTQRRLIDEMLEITDRAMLTPEEETWRDNAGSLIAYSEQHLKLDEVLNKLEL